MTKPKQYTSAVKTPGVWEMLQEEKTVTQITVEYPMHPGPLH